MKNVSSLKSNNSNSPKTPGGISKSLLTPCRRVGLSRNWRKNGPSPFISPLSSNSTDVKEEKNESRKRKGCITEESIECTVNLSGENDNNSEHMDRTPSRNVEVPRRKKSKTLLTTLNKPQEDITPQLEVCSVNCSQEQSAEVSHNLDNNSVNEIGEVVATPVHTKSKKSKKRMSPLLMSPKETKIDTENKQCNGNTPVVKPESKEEVVYTIKEKSPNDLRKECIVVIQKKIFKNVDNDEKNIHKDEKPPPKSIDSDSDEAPLILHKQNSTKSKTKAIIDDDDDFMDNRSSKAKPNKINDRKSKTKVKTAKPVKTRVEKEVMDKKQSSQSCFDDDDDDFDNKKTILIKKTYDKISKPIKAKSTGSITQRDIDILRERIEAKKKLLLAQSVTPDTEELRSLIKKWQKGCQNALMELLELMRTKFPDKESMDYSEILKTLKIPPSLVGYDSENDSFHSPDDASIILGQLNDL